MGYSVDVFKFLVEHQGSMRIAAKILSNKHVVRNPLFLFLQNLRIEHVVKKLEVPVAANIELTNNCNAQCIMCSHQHMKRNKGFQTYEMFQNIADQLKEMGVRKANLTGIGEGMLDKNVFKKLRYAKNVGIPETMITTNASMIYGDNVNELLETGIDAIRFSLDGVGEEYNRIRVGLDYDKIRQNILDLVNKREKGKYETKIYLNLLKKTDGLKDESGVVNTWKNIVDGFNFVYYMNWGNLEDNIVEHGYNNQAFIRRPPCPFLWNTINIMWEGQVALCCLDYNVISPIGHIKEQSIKNIWHGELMNKMRETHMRGDFSNTLICKDCTWYPNWWG